VVVDGDAVRDVGFGQLVGEIGARLGWPVVVKPATQGSSLGVTLAADAGAVPSSLLAALSYDSHALIERYVEGRDLAVAVIGNVGGEPSVLPIIEAIPEGDAYDFEARYEIGATRFECPADLPSLTTGAAEQLAIRAFEALECEGCVRVDMILDAGGELSILELDTVPGLTQTSLVPQAAQAAGMSFDQLVARMIDLALARS
jgi:D-alanine-D-alanine ligase